MTAPGDLHQLIAQAITEWREMERIEHAEAQSNRDREPRPANLSYHTALARERVFRICADRLAAALSASSAPASEDVVVLRIPQTDLPPDAARLLRDHAWTLYGDEPIASSVPASDLVPCDLCGVGVRFDTVIASPTWNAVIRENGIPEHLCTTCIIEQFAKRGVSFNCELWGADFNGLPVSVHVNSKKGGRRLGAGRSRRRAGEGGTGSAPGRRRADAGGADRNPR